MPKIEPAAQNTAQPYGADANQNQMTFQERLMQRFAPQDWVTVKNVDDEPFIWQYLPTHEEDFEYTPDPMKITRRGQPEMWQIDPGAQETLVGANAYIMIEGLYKKLVSKKAIAETPKQRPGVARNFNYADGGSQQVWIDRILVGKATLQFATSQPQTESTTTNEQSSTSPAKNPVGATESK